MKFYIVVIFLSVFFISCEKETTKEYDMGSLNGTCFPDKTCNTKLRCNIKNICEEIPEGEDRGPCFEDGTCNDGLYCYNNECLNSSIYCNITTDCGENSICVIDENNETSCQCVEGYQENSTGECVRFLSCDQDPCRDKGECIEDNGVISCNCFDPYTGLYCEECADGYERDGDICILIPECIEGSCNNHGVCDDSSGAIECLCETGYSGDYCESCDQDAGFYRDGDLCVTSCEDYTFHDSSYIHNIQIGQSTGDKECCFDMNGDSNIDNKLGDIIALLGVITNENYDQKIANSIEDGEICSIMEYHNMEQLESEHFDLTLLSCKDSDNNFENNLQFGSFYITPLSFEDTEEILCSGEPKYKFNESETDEDSNLTAFTDRLKLFDIPFVMGEYLSLDMREVKLEASLTENSDGIEILNGKLGGGIPVETLIDTLNYAYKTKCGCLDYEGDMISYEIVDMEYQITCQNDVSSSACTDEDPDFCKNISYCSTIAAIFKPDLDLDQNGVNESISIGVMLEGTPSNILGLYIEE